MKKKVFEIGDDVLLDITAFNGKHKIKKWERKNIQLTLGKEQYIANFDELLIGQEIKDHYQLKMNHIDQKTEEVQEIHLEVQNKNFESIKVGKEGDLLFKKISKERDKKYLEEIENLKTENKALLSMIRVTQQSLDKRDEEYNSAVVNFQNQAKEFENKAQILVKEKVDATKLHFQEQEENLKKYSSQKLLEEILPLLLNVNKAVDWASNSTNDEVKNYVNGFSHLLNQIDESLSNNKIIKITPKIGDTFNPEEHDILHQVETSDYKPDTIVKIITSGYKLFDRTILTAKVDVAKAK